MALGDGWVAGCVSFHTTYAVLNLKPSNKYHQIRPYSGHESEALHQNPSTAAGRLRAARLVFDVSKL